MWEAKEFRRVLKNGRTNPVVLSCMPSQSHLSGIQAADSVPLVSREYVVKAQGLPEVLPTSLFNEVFGNMLARHFGIITPDPCIVRISPAHAALFNRELQEHELKISSGYAAGCAFVSGGLAEITHGAYLTKQGLEQATRIFAFDMLVQNPDRRYNKPNCALKGEDIVAFDFESGFSFVYALFGAGDAWEIGRAHKAQDHLFYSTLHGKNRDLTEFKAILKSLRRSHLDEIIEATPENWRTHADKICEHLESAIMNADKFEMSLMGVLGCRS